MPKVVRKVSVGSAKKRAVVDRSSSSSESERAEREERDDEDERDEDNESFESIPRHIRLQIFSKLNELGDVANVCLTSREFNRTIETSERLWRRMLEMMIGQRQSEIIFSRRQIKERSESEPQLNELIWKKKFRKWCQGSSQMMQWCERKGLSRTSFASKPLHWGGTHAPVAEEGEQAFESFSPRYLHRCAQTGTDGSKIIIFGGQSARETFHNDVHFLDLDARANPTRAMKKLDVLTRGDAEAPFRRCSGAIQTLTVFDAETGKAGREVIALFGGSCGYLHGFSNSLSILQSDVPGQSISTALITGAQLTWYEPNIDESLRTTAGGHAGPQPRWGHCTVPYEGKMLIFGGSSSQACYNDLWECRLENDVASTSPMEITAKWTLLAPLSGADRSRMPCARAGGSISIVRDCLYLFGGCRISHTFNDLWKLDLKDLASGWEQIQTTGTPAAPRVGHATVVLGDRIIIQGGRGITPNKNSTPAPRLGKFSKEGLAAMQDLIFFESGFQILDVHSRTWLPPQYPLESDESNELQQEQQQQQMFADDATQKNGLSSKSPEDEDVREHRTGHALLLAPDGLVLIGGLGFNARFQSDVQLVKLF